MWSAYAGYLKQAPYRAKPTRDRPRAAHDTLATGPVHGGRRVNDSSETD